MRNPRLAQAFGAYSNDEIWKAMRQGDTRPDLEINQGFHSPEFDAFSNETARIGSPDRRRSNLFAETLPKGSWANPSGVYDQSAIKSIVAVHHLREVVCLYGFTRFDAPPALFDDGLEEVKLSVEGARLAKSISWLPAIEQFGEGIFVQLDSALIADWSQTEAVRGREALLKRGFDRWKQKSNYKGEFPGIAYVLLHTLSHALMSELALECGYPYSALKERVYALRDSAQGRGGAFARLGILIYSASPGAQGTLGGIVAQSSQFGRLLDGALERLEYCSNDPICADHDPGQKEDDRRLLGAACPSCLLAPETSCEKQNLFLDRALLVETLAANNASLFRRPSE
jgi:hypothetical protein